MPLMSYKPIYNINITIYECDMHELCYCFIDDHTFSPSFAIIPDEKLKNSPTGWQVLPNEGEGL